jgi:hypothetical protein
MNERSKHNWIKVRFIPPSGERNAYYGKACRYCGVRVYQFGRLTRWRWPNGQVADFATIDEIDCHSHPPDCDCLNCGQRQD